MDNDTVSPDDTVSCQVTVSSGDTVSQCEIVLLGWMCFVLQKGKNCMAV